METIKIFSFSCNEFTVTRRISQNTDPSCFPVHSHAQLEIVLCNSGRHGYAIDGNTLSLTPGSLIAISPGVPHRVLVGEEDYDRYSVIIHPSLLPQGAIDGFKKNYLIHKISANEEIFLLFKRAERLARELPAEIHETVFHALALELYYTLINDAREEQPTESEIVNRALAYIDSNFTKIQNVSEISDSLYISKSYFHSLFRAHTKKTPLAYINERRLHLARMRILAGERISLVYRECGFCNYISFFRSYKKLYGHAPSDLSSIEESGTENAY